VAAFGFLLRFYIARSLYWHGVLSDVSNNSLFMATRHLLVLNSAKYWALIF